MKKYLFTLCLLFGLNAICGEKQEEANFEEESELVPLVIAPPPVFIGNLPPMRDQLRNHLDIQHQNAQLEENQDRLNREVMVLNSCIAALIILGCDLFSLCFFIC